MGETRAAQPLVDALQRACPEARFLITHMTPTGRQTGHELFAGAGLRVVQAYLPYDLPGAQRRFLAAWRPSLGLILETELWPNLVREAQAAGVPLALVNARLSERSLARGLRAAGLIRPALAGLTRVLAQTPADARRLERLGRRADAVTGNLKFDSVASPGLQALGRGWALRLAPRGRCVVLAASTREGEEAALLAYWCREPRDAGAVLGKAAPDAPGERAQDPAGAPLLVVVPRHPQRFGEVARLIEASGRRWARRADLDAPDGALAECEILLGDSMGEMGAWYALADLAIMGGSIAPFGSQNLIEACAAGCPVLIGPHDFNFAQAAADAIACGAARRVADAASAVEAARALTTDSDARTRMAQAALDFSAAHRGATARTLEALAPLLPGSRGTATPRI